MSWGEYEFAQCVRLCREFRLFVRAWNKVRPPLAAYGAVHHFHNVSHSTDVGTESAGYVGSEVLGDDDMDQIPELEYTKLRRRPWVDQPQWLVILGETHTSWAAIDESPTTVRTCDRCKCTGHSTALCQLHVGLPTNSIFGRSKTVGRYSRCKYCKMADKHCYGAKKRQRETNIGGRS